MTALTLIGDIGTYHVEILCEDPDRPTMMKIDLVTPFEMNLVDDVFANARVASATLASRLLMRNAIAFLEQNDVPRTHPLWDLNHSDLWIRTPPPSETFDL